MLGDAGEDVGEPGLWVDVVELGGDDEAIHHGCALATAVGACEQPRLSSERDTSQGSFGGIVGEADPPVREETREGWPALEHVVHGLGDLGMARELGALLAHPGLELGDERGTLGLARREPLIGVEAVDGTLDLEQRVDAPDGLERDGGDHGGVLSFGLASGARGDVGQHEELAPAMGPAARLQDKAWTSIGFVELAESAVSVGLQDPGVRGEMALRMFASSITRVVEHGRGRCSAAEGPVVAHIDPCPAGMGLALGQNRHRRVVAVQPLGGQHMGFEAVMERTKGAAAGTHLIGKVERLKGTPSRA